MEPSDHSHGGVDEPRRPEGDNVRPTPSRDSGAALRTAPIANDADRRSAQMSPSDLQSREAALAHIIRTGVRRVNSATGQTEVVGISIANADDASSGFLYASSRVVFPTGATIPGLPERVAKLFRPEVERHGDTLIFTTLNNESDALGIVESLNKDFGGEVATIDHVVFSAPGGGSVCREGADPEPADRPNGPHRDDLVKGNGIRVAVIDNGIAPEALTDSWLDGLAVAPADRDPLRVYGSPAGDHNVLDLASGHGTFVAGVIRQVAPGATLLAIRALDSNGVGFDSDIAAAIYRALNEKADIINLSIGGYTMGDTPPPAMALALAQVPASVAVIAAAGNESTTRPSFPASAAGVLGVAALDADGGDHREFATAPLAAYSNRPSSVDDGGFVAVAGRWTSTFVSGVENPVRDQPQDHFDGYALSAGTSFAAAALSGAIAVVAAKHKLPAGEIASRLSADANASPSRMIRVDVWSA